MSKKKKRAKRVWENQRIFHYTTFSKLRKILEDQVIKLTAVYIEPNEKPAVWFSTNPDWEETVRKAIANPETGEQSPPLSRDALFKVSETDYKGALPVRIEVDPELPFLTWKQFKRQSGISKRMALGLEKAATEWGARPKEWFALFFPVAADFWLGVEFWDGESWVKPTSIEELAFLGLMEATGTENTIH